jgi:hypothetical protein
MIERGKIQRCLDGARRQQRFDLAAEVETAFPLRIVERLLAGAVAREEQRPLRLVPQRNAEHAAQAPEGIFSPLFVGVDDRLGITGGRETMAERFELRAQLEVVVDLAVEDDPDRAGLVVDRLAAAGKVDDAQSPHAQADARLHVDSLVVRPPVPDDFAHAVNEVELVLLARRLAAKGDDRRVRETCYPAHIRSSSMHG